MDEPKESIFDISWAMYLVTSYYVFPFNYFKSLYFHWVQLVKSTHCCVWPMVLQIFAKSGAKWAKSVRPCWPWGVTVSKLGPSCSSCIMSPPD